MLLASYESTPDRQLFPLPRRSTQRNGFSLEAIGFFDRVYAGMAGAASVRISPPHASRQTVLQIGIAVFSAGTALTVLSSGSRQLLPRGNGIGEAMRCMLLAIAVSYFASRRGAAVGAINFFFAVGAIIGPAVGGVLISTYQSWRVPMVVYGCIGFAAMVLVALAVKPWFSEAHAAPGDMTDRGGVLRCSTGTPGATAMRRTAALSLWLPG